MSSQVPYCSRNRSYGSIAALPPGMKVFPFILFFQFFSFSVFLVPRFNHKTFSLLFQEFLRVSPTSEFPTSEAATHLLALTHKLSGCVNQLQQFSVRVHDLPDPAGTSGASGGYLRSRTSASRFLQYVPAHLQLTAASVLQ